MKQHQQKVELLSVKQAAQILNVSTKTVRRRIECGEIHHHRIGRAIRVSAEDLRAYTNSVRQ